MRTPPRLVIAFCVSLGAVLVVQAADPFATGATWKGQRVFKAKGSQDWSLTVTGRKGDTFKGEVVLPGKNGPVTHAVTGKVSPTRPRDIAFETEKKGKFQQSFKGAYANGKVDLTFSGTGPGGADVSGTAALTAVPPGPAPATGPLTGDEKTLMALATRWGSYFGGIPPDPSVEIRPPAMSREAKAKLLIDQFRAGGRGKRVAAGRYACDSLIDMLNDETTKYNKLYTGFPDAMRDMAWRTTGLALQGKDVPPPFSKDFQEFAAPGIGWFDNLRSSMAKQEVIKLHFERSYFQTVVAVEQDLLPLYKSPNALPKDQFLLKAGPGGQHLRIRYTGKEPLTSVAMLSLVRQNPKGRKNANQIPLAAIDLFNRSFGATDRQATDAMTYLQAAESHARMPKYSLLYLPELKPQAEFTFEVGYMERGDALEGNTNTFAVYSDQGVLRSPDLSGFPILPRDKW